MVATTSAAMPPEARRNRRPDRPFSDIGRSNGDIRLGAGDDDFRRDADRGTTEAPMTSAAAPTEARRDFRRDAERGMTEARPTVWYGNIGRSSGDIRLGARADDFSSDAEVVATT